MLAVSEGSKIGKESDEFYINVKDIKILKCEYERDF